jgi:hypothetical protein
MRDIKNTVADFGYRYFWEFKVANLNYANNKLEKDADAKANNYYRDAYNRYRSFRDCSRQRNIEVRPTNKNISFARNKVWKTCSGYKTIFQGDGNFVVYNRSGQAVFNTQTHNRGAKVLAMQTDGNLVIYADGGKALWHSHTNGNPGAFLAIQQDGNVVIYSRKGKALWSTRTNGK